MKMRLVFGALTIEHDAENPRALFKAVAELQETFHPDETCGHCGKREFSLRMRKPAKGEYYEIMCVGCQYRLGMGIPQNGGGLFPKRKDKDGMLYDKRGWLPPWGGAEE